MAQTGPEAGAKGVLEEIKGRAKQAWGALTGDGAKQAEGEAQQQKADAERDVARKEAEADTARAEAAAREAEQRAHQRGS